MCGRFSQVTDKQTLQKILWPLDVPETLESNYNLAPTQKAYVVTNEAQRVLQQLTWGLVPFWDKEGKPSGRMINARSETVAQKPSFRMPFQKRRCLIPVDSFYEWKRREGEKIPYRIQFKEEDLIIFAGLWEIWKKGNERLETFTILTTRPNAEMTELHDRMPLILETADKRKFWLSDAPKEELDALVQEPVPDGILSYYEVSKAVNAVRNNGPDLHLSV